MLLTRAFVAVTVLCNEHTQERGRAGLVVVAAATSPTPSPSRCAARRRGLSGRFAGRAVPPLRQAGLPVRRRGAARAVCLPVGGQGCRAGFAGLRPGGLGPLGGRTGGVDLSLIHISEPTRPY